MDTQNQQNQNVQPATEDITSRVNQLETDFVNHKHRDYDKTPRLTILESDITLADNTTDNVTSTKHGFAPKSPADATKFLNGGATPGWTIPPGHSDVQTFTVDGTWTKPTGTTGTEKVLVQMWGGGASGGGTLGNVLTESGAGGGGEYIEAWFRASDLNSTVGIVVAVAVSGGVGASDGTDGGNTTFATTFIARGGKKGLSGNNTGVGGNGSGYFPGLGANPGGDSLDGLSGGGGSNASGGAGGKSVKGGGGGAAQGAAGGGSITGGNGGDAPSGNGNGGAGAAPGGGGSACHSAGAGSKTGGQGARGEVRVTTFNI